MYRLFLKVFEKWNSFVHGRITCQNSVYCMFLRSFFFNFFLEKRGNLVKIIFDIYVV